MDYITENLNSLYDTSCDFGSAIRQYCWVLRMREYYCRLICAIVWDKEFYSCAQDKKLQLVKSIFGKKTCLGDFKNAVEQLNREKSPNKAALIKSLNRLGRV